MEESLQSDPVCQSEVSSQDSALLSLPDDLLARLLKCLDRRDDALSVRLTCRRLREQQVANCSSVTLTLGHLESDETHALFRALPACLARYNSLSRLSLRLEAPFRVHMARNSLQWAQRVPELLRPLRTLRSLRVELAEAGYAWEAEHWAAIAEASSPSLACLKVAASHLRTCPPLSLFPSLLSFSLHCTMGPSDLLPLTGAPRLTSLSVLHASPALLSALPSSCPRLKHVTIEESWRVSPALPGLAALPSLASLFLRSCKDVRIEHLAGLLGAATRLAHLSLSECDSLDSHDIWTMVSLCPHVARLSLSVGYSKSLFLPPLASPFLRHLDLSAVLHLAPRDAAAIATCPSLRSLHLCNLIDALPAFAAGWPPHGPPLSALSISNCHDREGGGYGAFKAAFAHVHSLAMGRCIGLSAGHLAEALASAREVRSLTLTGLEDVVDGSVLRSICVRELEEVHVEWAGGEVIDDVEALKRIAGSS